MDRRMLLQGLLLGALAPGARADGALWALLGRGGHAVLLRHAVTDTGVGDPPGFRLGVCATQRNLSEQGRSDARRLGEELRARRVPVAGLLSSPWCRCLDTARLAFGRDAEGAAGSRAGSRWLNRRRWAAAAAGTPTSVRP